MKANQSIRRDNKGFTYLIPFTIAIVISISLLVMGVYIVGTISDSLEGTYPDNITPTAIVDNTYWHNGTTSGYKNITLPCTAGELSAAITGFNINANRTGWNVTYNLTSNAATTYTDQVVENLTWHNTTLTTL